MIDRVRNTVINPMVILAICLMCFNPGLAGSDSLFIDKDGKVIVGGNLEVTEKVTAKSFEGNGSELAIESNKSITEIDSRMNTMNNTKLDKAGGVVTGNVSIGTKDNKADLEVTGEIRGKPWYSQEYTWHRGPMRKDPDCNANPPTKMTPSDRTICFLISVGGWLYGGGEVVSIFEKDGYWWLGGSACRRDVQAKARCIGLP